MKKPVLLIMAAGMGSRYGGLKQIDPVDREGHIIMDFSIYDAMKAGFSRFIFIIRREHLDLFKESIGDRISRKAEVSYVFQDLDNIPEGCAVPEGRLKPWGTGHAILSCIDEVDGPFAVINADDYYGCHAFRLIYDYLVTHQDDDRYRYAMIGYRLGNTLTDNGHVSRGICETDENGMLRSIHELTYIVKTPQGAAFSEDDGEIFTDISPEETVSMNLWGFSASILPELKKQFVQFFREEVPQDPMKKEFFLPTVVSRLIDADKASVQVITTPDQWFGVTYKEDRKSVEEAIIRMKNEHIYPEQF